MYDGVERRRSKNWAEVSNCIDICSKLTITVIDDAFKPLRKKRAKTSLIDGASKNGKKLILLNMPFFNSSGN